MRMLVDGVQLPEALRSDGRSLYFSDAAGGGVYHWTEAGIETVVAKRRGVGGLALHADGGLVVGGRTLIQIHDGVTRELFAPDGALGVNDLTVDPEGAVLVGTLRMDWRDPDAGRPGEIWRIAANGTELLAEGIAYPNGMALAPGGRTLYVADYVGACVHAIDLETRARRVLTSLERGNADGLAVDAEGRIWVATGPGGSFDVFAADGRLLDRLDAPKPFAVTLCFGDADPHDLYLAAGDAIFQTRSDTPGLPVPRARI